MFWELHDLGSARFTRDGNLLMACQFPSASRVVHDAPQSLLYGSDVLRRHPELVQHRGGRVHWGGGVQHFLA